MKRTAAIVKAIWHDLCDRKGYDLGCLDRETQAEIKQAWRKAIDGILAAPAAPCERCGKLAKLVQYARDHECACQLVGAKQWEICPRCEHIDEELRKLSDVWLAKESGEGGK